MSRPVRVGVLGGGSWGSTVASLVAANAPTILWARHLEVVREINERHTNHTYLPDLSLHAGIVATDSLQDAVKDADALVVAIPSHGFRGVLEAAAPFLRPWAPVLSVTKGLEHKTNLRMTRIIEEVLPGHPAGFLGGPNLAREVLSGYAAAAVVAMPDETVARSLQQVFAGRNFRVYTSVDVAGCELGGALKNVIAISAGMAVGLGVGDNTRAMVITRGLAEMTRLGVAMGGDPRTFAGLTGMGDLMATCLSPLSRNRQVGEQLARDRTIADIVADMNMVAEGIKTCSVVVDLARIHNVDMPIAREVDAVVNHGRTVRQAFRGLGRMAPTSEIHGVA